MHSTGFNSGLGGTGTAGAAAGAVETPEDAGATAAAVAGGIVVLVCDAVVLFALLTGFVDCVCCD